MSVVRNGPYLGVVAVFHAHQEVAVHVVQPLVVVDFCTSPPHHTPTRLLELLQAEVRALRVAHCVDLYASRCAAARTLLHVPLERLRLTPSPHAYVVARLVHHAHHQPRHLPAVVHALFSLGASGLGSGASSGSASRRRTTMEAAGGFTEACVTIGGSTPETVGEMEAVETCGVSVTVVVEASGKAEVEDLCEMTGVGASAEAAAVGV